MLFLYNNVVANDKVVKITFSYMSGGNFRHQKKKKLSEGLNDDFVANFVQR